MTKTFPRILLLLLYAALLASCSAKPTPPVSPLSAAAPASPASGTAPQGGRAMFFPGNPNRPANIPALGIPADARHSHASSQ